VEWQGVITSEEVTYGFEVVAEASEGERYSQKIPMQLLSPAQFTKPMSA